MKSVTVSKSEKSENKSGKTAELTSKMVKTMTLEITPKITSETEPEITTVFISEKQAEKSSELKSEKFSEVKLEVKSEKLSIQSDEEREMLDKIFSFLVNHGLEGASIREICKDTGIVQGSLYYWFSDKMTIICKATEYGLKKVTDEIFEYVFSKIDNLSDLFENCLDYIEEYKKDLRFICQMIASPVYGEKIREDGKYFKTMYDRYAVELSEHLGYDLKKVKPIVYIVVSAVLDYAIWDDKENAKTKIDFISSIIPKIMAR